MVNRCKRKIYFEGIDTSWNRVKGGNHWQLLSKIAAEYNYNNPSASIQIWRKPML
jgi:hypothetical protein